MVSQPLHSLHTCMVYYGSFWQFLVQIEGVGGGGYPSGVFVAFIHCGMVYWYIIPS